MYFSITKQPKRLFLNAKALYVYHNFHPIYHYRISFIPRVNFRLLPSNNIPQLTVSYNLSSASSELIDAQITTPLEGALSTLDGLTKIVSKTGKGYGYIRLNFDKSINIDATRFEIASLLRQLEPSFPQKMAFPRISTSLPEEERESKNLLTYVVYGAGSKNEVLANLESNVLPQINTIEGVHTAQVSGVDKLGWTIEVDGKRLHTLNLSEKDIQNSLYSTYINRNLGLIPHGNKELLPVKYTGIPTDSISWKIHLFKKIARIISLPIFDHYKAQTRSKIVFPYQW